MSGCLNKLGSQLNIKEKDKTREIKKKKNIFLKQATWPPVLAHCAVFHPRTESCTTTAHINADNAMIEMKVRPQFISDAGIATDCHQLPQPFAKINTEVLKFCF